jgi:hypothetical protein
MQMLLSLNAFDMVHNSLLDLERFMAGSSHSKDNCDCSLVHFTTPVDGRAALGQRRQQLQAVLRQAAARLG